MMQLAARTGAWSGKPLPYLRRVAYLESHGTEWIDTLINSAGGGGFDIEIKVAYKIVNDTWVFGYYYPNWRFGYQGLFKPEGCVAEKYEDDIYVVRSTIKSPSTVGFREGSRSILLMCQRLGIYGSYKGQPHGFIKGALYYAKIVKDEVVVFNAIPVLDLSGRPAMYDEVSGQLFYNQGTGEFTWGELDAASNAPSQLGGGGVRLCARRSYRRSSRPSARFCALASRHSQEWEVAA